MRILRVLCPAVLCLAALSVAMSQAGTPSHVVKPQESLEALQSPTLFQSSGNPSAVPTWSASYAFTLGKPHNAFAIVSNTFKSQTALFGVKPLSALAITFAGTQIQTPASSAPQGLTAGVGGELMYTLSGNVYASIGLGYAASAGQQNRFFWLLGGAYRF